VNAASLARPMQGIALINGTQLITSLGAEGSTNPVTS